MFFFYLYKEKGEKRKKKKKRKEKRKYAGYKIREGGGNVAHPISGHTPPPAAISLILITICERGLIAGVLLSLSNETHWPEEGCGRTWGGLR